MSNRFNLFWGYFFVGLPKYFLFHLVRCHTHKVTNSIWLFNNTALTTPLVYASLSEKFSYHLPLNCSVANNCIKVWQLFQVEIHSPIVVAILISSSITVKNFTEKRKV